MPGIELLGGKVLLQLSHLFRLVHHQPLESNQILNVDASLLILELITDRVNAFANLKILRVHMVAEDFDAVLLLSLG